jgi:PIN domain nuclease of toxin-antitoxin system
LKGALWHHRDPFDRLLVAQAISEPAKLLTADVALMPYSDLVEIVKPVGPSTSSG